MADLRFLHAGAADEDGAGGDEAQLTGSGVELGIAKGLGIDHNTHGSQHGGEHGAQNTHMVHIDAAGFREPGIGARGAHADAQLGPAEQPHQAAADQEEHNAAGGNLNAPNGKGAQLIQNVGVVAQQAVGDTEAPADEQVDHPGVGIGDAHPHHAH